MLSNPNNVNSQMQQLANNAVSAAKNKFSISLDFTENSLQQLEILLQQAHEGYKQGKSNGNWSNAAIEKTVRVWGSYFGEVIRLQMGGNWIEDQNNVFLQLNSRRLDPLGQVRSRIVDGPLYNVQSFFQGLKSGIQDNLNQRPFNFNGNMNNIQPSSAKKDGAKNRSSIYIAGIIGLLFFVGLCILGFLIIQKQGILSIPVMEKNISLNLTQTNTSASVIININQSTIISSPTSTNILLPTDTPFPTSTRRPTLTPVPIVPTVDPFQVVLDNGFYRWPYYDQNCYNPCYAYLGNFGTSALVHFDGSLSIGYDLNSDKYDPTEQMNVIRTVIRDIYGSSVDKWIFDHTPLAEVSPQTGNVSGNDIQITYKVNGSDYQVVIQIQP